MNPPSNPPNDSAFIPRREFIRDPKPPPNSFSLLAISGSSSVRLYSFIPSIVDSLRVFLRQSNLLSDYREDLNNQFFEFTLEGKPWSSIKSVATERLLIEILTVISHHGYQFLSTVDYGRESDDRVALAFSRPSVFSQSSSPSPTPIPPTNASGTTLSGKQRSYPFALSFSSMTCLRVICPPLHSTPAILQAVRGAWPRGVDSEKKIGDNCFEFKLKGYKWFHEDTFATDSLRHILALLSSLDAHSFELQTSISLTNSRSRVKDLWIFTGPPSVDDTLTRDSPSPSILNSSPDMMRQVLSPSPFSPHSPAMHSHRRLATEPLSPPRPASPLRHGRAVTEEPHIGTSPKSHQNMPSNVLRKPAPKAQVPLSVHDDGENADTEGYRTHLPSTIPSGAENMTGIGATSPNVFYSTSPFGTEVAEERYMQAPLPDVQPMEEVPGPLPIPAQVPDEIPHEPPIPAQVPDEVPDQLPISAQGSDGVPAQVSALREYEQSPVQTPGAASLSGPLLSPNAFRDSALSTTTDVSAVIPIKWTGPGVDVGSETGRMPSTPMIPGGWKPTPVEEKDEVNPMDLYLSQDREPEQPIQDVRVASPEVMDTQARQSEAGLIVSPVVPPVPSAVKDQKAPERAPEGQEAERRATAVSSGQGWVMVNVEEKSPVDNVQLAAPEPTPVQKESASTSPASTQDGISQTTSPVSPAAKAIVIIDAVESKKSKAKKDSQSSSRIKRFLSLTRRDSSKEAEEMKTAHSRTISMGQKLRRIGTPEATRNDERRRSFD